MSAGFKYLAPVIVFFGLVLFLPVRTQAFDFFSNPNNSTSACGSSDTSSSPVCQTESHPKNPIINAIRIATNIIATLAGALAVVMIIVSGFTLITSGGNQEAVAKSRKRIISAIIGLSIIALSWTIISFVIGKLIK